MFDAFAPLLALVGIYFIFAVVAKAAKKAASVQKKTSGTPAASVPETSAPPPVAEPQLREIQPTVSIHNHDDSIYLGSMNAVTGEGYDPCHEEQLSSLTLYETIEPAPSVTAPGLQLKWTGDEIVRGLVISEILKRKGA